ncbi:MAG: BspA family leucine-rich repeat surface protein, partial [Bacteroidota bacterium]
MKTLKKMISVLFGLSDFSSEERQVHAENKRLEDQLKKLKELEQQIITKKIEMHTMKRATPLLITLLLCFINVNAQNEDLFITTWKTDNPGPSSNTEITIPTTGGGYNYEVDWTFDGTAFNAENSGVTGNITHDYGMAGEYTVAIRGDFPRIFFNNSGDRNKILTIEQWGTIQWTSMARAFAGCQNLDITNPGIDNPDLSGVTQAIEMFLGASKFKGRHLSNWDTGNIRNMSRMFQGANSFNGAIGNWDVSKVSGFQRMFASAASFDRNLGNWDLSKASIMDLMLAGTNLSTNNYDATLMGWAVDNSGVDGDDIDDIPINKSITINNSSYCQAESARNSLTTPTPSGFGWTINDNGLSCDQLYFITTWKTNNPGSSGNTQITIPTFPGETYNYDVDWNYNGDTFNPENSGVTGSITHDYGTAGEYRVAIRGVFPRIYFNDGGDKEKILTIEQWGDIAWSNMASAFMGCSNLNID